MTEELPSCRYASGGLVIAAVRLTGQLVNAAHNVSLGRQLSLVLHRFKLCNKDPGMWERGRKTRNAITVASGLNALGKGANSVPDQPTSARSADCNVLAVHPTREIVG